MIISHTVMPNGGWVYKQGQITLIGETFDLLKKNVIDHRKFNGIPEGNVQADIEEYLVKKFPHMKKNSVLA